MNEGSVETFDTATVSRRTGATIRQLDHWDRLGIVSPAIQPATGSGSRRRYSLDDLFQILVVRSLREIQVPLDVVHETVSALRKAQIDRRCAFETVAVIVGQRVTYLGDQRAEVAEALQEAPAATVVNLGLLAARADELAAAPAKPRTELLELAGRIFQVIIHVDDGMYHASCKAFPDCLGRAQSAEAAVNSLRVQLEATPAALPSSKHRRAEIEVRPPKKGASTWGDEW